MRTAVLNQRTELIDVYDEQDRWLGVKERELVHRDGDWHRCFHCWIVSCRPVPQVVVQRRAAALADAPGMLDVTVSGHVLAGETLHDALRRELREELEISELTGSTSHVMRHVIDLRLGGKLFRELTDVFLLRDDRPIAAYTPSAGEIEALIPVSVASGIELWAGVTDEIESVEHRMQHAVPIRIRREDFVGSHDAAYFTSVLERARDLCGGRST